jgi:Uma2 family endonuclease
VPPVQIGEALSRVAPVCDAASALSPGSAGTAGRGPAWQTESMRTVVLGESREIRELIEQRQRTGADLYDEMWKGEYHMAPAPRGSHGLAEDQLAQILGPLARHAGLFGSGPFNLGDSFDYRVPDRGYRRTQESRTWYPTAAIVVEIISPDDESWAKLDFYAAHEVDEVLIVDPETRRVTWLGRAESGYAETDRSALLGITAADLTAQLDWPED